MPVLSIAHITTYAYSQPVTFGEHRLMVRPRESYDQQLLAARIDIDPAPSELRWLHDVFSNAVAIASFDAAATHLYIAAHATLDHRPAAIEAFALESYARRYPFTYSSEDMPDLIRSIERQSHDPERVVDRWARAFIGDDGRVETTVLLERITRAIHRDFAYVGRSEPGTQSPLETLAKRQGTCRDFAVLMIEAARALGLAARFVSGYLYDPAASETRIGGGNTHAWVSVFLPGSGWVEYDPTNGIVGSHGLIRVAVARDPYQAVPLSGTWTGLPGSCVGMDVTVTIAVEEPGRC
ncbi:MAG: transglutaminase family protein [Sphingomonadaceae bacterium]|nr:transglutaminase family protein [Sphingomonadaceae bacterium]